MSTSVSTPLDTSETASPRGGRVPSIVRWISVLLIVGSLLIGALSGSGGYEQINAFTSDIFIGMLCLFLLDMGIVAARRLQELGHTSGQSGAARMSVAGMATWGVLFALGNALIAGSVAWALALPEGDWSPFDRKANVWRRTAYPSSGHAYGR